MKGNNDSIQIMKKALRGDANTARWRAKAEPKIFAPPKTPFPGRRTAKIESTGDGHSLHLQTKFGEDRCTQFRVIVVTDPQTKKQTHKHTNKCTHRQDRLQYTAPLSLARSVIMRVTGRCMFDSALRYRYTLYIHASHPLLQSLSSAAGHERGRQRSSN